MCGLAVIAGGGSESGRLEAMLAAQKHRGPDDQGSYWSPDGFAGLGHNRLSILDLSPAGRQPMWSRDGSLAVVLNGEIYNYLELRSELSEYPYFSRTDTEVILAAYQRWGEECLDRFLGMFAFVLWDARRRRLFAARDRFGVKPLYYHVEPDGGLSLASEIKALHAAGVERRPDEVAWATYLAKGLYDHSARTFWKGVLSLPAGHKLTWEDGRLSISRWYDLAARVGAEFDRRSEDEVGEEYLSLLQESVRLRFRSDVPVGINLSGGLDSSTLLGLVHAVEGAASEVKAYTFVTGDVNYDELPWVQQMLERTRHPLRICTLTPDEVPGLAESVQRSQDEPYGGIPTLAYAKIFEQARADGTIVLLDGQGMDEQWAGYDYYEAAAKGCHAGLVQGAKDPTVRPECLAPWFRAMAEEWEPPKPFPDALRNLQYRDACHTKLPRALRFNDRISMRSGTELRELFLDHRLFELAMRQPAERKLSNGSRKRMLRRIARRLMPDGVAEAPKRPVQTPQREWLRGPLRDWVGGCLRGAAGQLAGSWIDEAGVQESWDEFQSGRSDNSFYLWQWVSLRLGVGSGVGRQ